jgi:hypothetical protein
MKRLSILLLLLALFLALTAAFLLLVLLEAVTPLHTHALGLRALWQAWNHQANYQQGTACPDPSPFSLSRDHF